MRLQNTDYNSVKTYFWSDNNMYTGKCNKGQNSLHTTFHDKKIEYTLARLKKMILNF